MKIKRNKKVSGLKILTLLTVALSIITNTNVKAMSVLNTNIINEKKIQTQENVGTNKQNSTKDSTCFIDKINGNIKVCVPNYPPNDISVRTSDTAVKTNDTDNVITLVKVRDNINTDITKM